MSDEAISDKLTFDEVCLLLGLPPMDEALRSWAYEFGGDAYSSVPMTWYEREASPEKFAIEGADAEEKAERAVADRHAARVQGELGKFIAKLRLQVAWEQKEWNFWVATLEPMLSWEVSAEATRSFLHKSHRYPFSFPTLDAFLDSGKPTQGSPYTPRDAVLRYLHWMIDCGWAFEAEPDYETASEWS